MNAKRSESRNGVRAGAADVLVPVGRKKALGGTPGGRTSKADQQEEEKVVKKLVKKKAAGFDRAESAEKPRASSPGNVRAPRGAGDQELDSRAKTVGLRMQAAVKKVGSRVPRRVPSDGGPASSAAAPPDRSNPTSSNAAGSGGDRVGPSILAGLKTGVLAKLPAKKMPAPKTGPWRKIICPTPQHVEWKAPMEYASSTAGGWGSFDDDDDEPQIEVPEDQMDPTADLVGEEVYNDGMAPDDEETVLLEQAKSKAKPDKSRKWATPPLCFESRFESGNLRKAVRRSETEYSLFMRDDVCSKEQGKEVPHCAQWFYFKVVNACPSKMYTMSIVNFVKPDSMYREGMRPLFYSRAEEKKNAKGWYRCGENIQYFANSRKFMKGSNEHHYHTLKFTLVFPHADDECYMAMCYPYTYTDVQKHLRELSACPLRSHLFTRNEFCRTMSGNLLDLLVRSASARARACVFVRQPAGSSRAQSRRP